MKKLTKAEVRTRVRELCDTINDLTEYEAFTYSTPYDIVDASVYAPNWCRDTDNPDKPIFRCSISYRDDADEKKALEEMAKLESICQQAVLEVKVKV